MLSLRHGTGTSEVIYSQPLFALFVSFEVSHLVDCSGAVSLCRYVCITGAFELFKIAGSNLPVLLDFIITLSIFLKSSLWLTAVVSTLSVLWHKDT